MTVTAAGSDRCGNWRAGVRRLAVVVLVLAASLVAPLTVTAADGPDAATAGAWLLESSDAVYAHIYDPPTSATTHTTHTPSDAARGGRALANAPRSSTNWNPRGRATKGPRTTRLYRSVDDDELADIQASGRYRTGPGQEGKPFYPSEGQASRFSRQMYPRTGRPQTVTSIDVPLDLLRTADPFFPAREGPALFLRQLPTGRPSVHNASPR